MASKVQVVLIDDMDGGAADSTVSFSLEGVNYEIDLSEANAQRLRNALEPFIGAGRRVAAGKRAGRRGSAVAGRGKRSAEIRSWARANGIEVSARGRVPADVIAKFEAAH